MDASGPFGPWLKHFRTSRDLTQEELAADVGCAVETIRKIESGARRPSKEIAHRLAEVLVNNADERHQFVQRARGLLPDEPPPSVAAARHNLPSHLTSFVGREREVVEVRALLSASRLVTLTGVGGTGKTRMALEVGATLRYAYAGGVWVIELAPLTDPALVTQTVAAVLGLREEPHRPLHTTLTATLQSAPTLLIFDNCEHLIAASAQLAETLLHACPHLRVLATSRESLGISGEALYLVPTLSTPDAQHLPALEELQHIGSVRLFVERVQAVHPHFGLTEANVEAVATICQRLDGLPLALELAAVRVRSLPVAEIAVHLDHRFRLLRSGSRTALLRQQTLQALIDWSYDLLSPNEQRLFACLSVFSGDWTLEAAEAICVGDGLDGEAVLDTLTYLVDKSLVVLNRHEATGRYTMLETIRLYAVERLAESGQAHTVQRRHVEYYLALAEQAEPELIGAQQDVWFPRLAVEHTNLRAAIRWAVEQGDIDVAVRYCAALGRFWWVHSHLSEGRRWLYIVLEKSSGEQSIRHRKALRWAGALAWAQGDIVAAQQIHHKALKLWQDASDQSGIAGALNDLGNVAMGQYDFPLARKYYQEAVTLFRSIGDKRGLAIALINLGYLVQEQGDYPGAICLLDESLQLGTERQDIFVTAETLLVMATIAYMEDNLDLAANRYQECLGLLHHLGAKQRLPSVLVGLAAVSLKQGNPERAAQLYGASAMLAEATGQHMRPGNRERYEHGLALTRTMLGDVRFAEARAEGRAMTLEQVVAYALEAGAQETASRPEKKSDSL